jgi:hypothetical protein
MARAMRNEGILVVRWMETLERAFLHRKGGGLNKRAHTYRYPAHRTGHGSRLPIPPNPGTGPASEHERGICMCVRACSGLPPFDVEKPFPAFPSNEQRESHGPWISPSDPPEPGYRSSVRTLFAEETKRRVSGSLPLRACLVFSFSFFRHLIWRVSPPPPTFFDWIPCLPRKPKDEFRGRIVHQHPVKKGGWGRRNPPD